MKTGTKQPNWKTGDLVIREAKSPFRDVCRFDESEFDANDDARNMDLIVRAVNSHGALLEALKAIAAVWKAQDEAGHVDMYYVSSAKNMVKAAIAAAETEVQP